MQGLLALSLILTPVNVAPEPATMDSLCTELSISLADGILLGYISREQAVAIILRCEQSQIEAVL